MTRSKWDWQRIGDDLETVLVAVGTYPTYFVSRFVASVRYGWALGQNRPEAAAVVLNPEREPGPREYAPEEPRSAFVPNPVDPPTMNESAGADA